MATVDKAVLERRLKPIYDAIDNFNTKKAISEAEKVLKKHPNTPAAKLLKSLALIRAERFDEAFVIIDAMDTEDAQHDESTLAVFVHCYKEAALPYRVCKLYERVITYQPTEENLTQLFMAYVRTRQYNKQQLIATRLYKDFKNPPYFFWSIMSTYMQGKDEPEKMFFKLAMAKLDAYFKNNRPDGHSQVDLHLMVLENNKRYKDALSTLTENLHVMSTASQFTETRRLQLLLSESRYSEVMGSAKTMLASSKDDWTLWTLLFDAAFGTIKELGKDDDQISKLVRDISESLNERCAIKCKHRGPFLARLEWMTRLRAEGIDATAIHGEPYELLISYVHKFFKKPCCYIDLKPYLELLPSNMVVKFVKEYQDFVEECLRFDGGANSDGSLIRSVILLNRLKRRFGHIDDLSKQEKCETISLLYHDMRMYTVDVLSGSDALQLIVAILWKEWVENDNWKSFYECVLLLEWAAVRFKSCAFTKLMLCRAYGETGNLNRLIALSKALDIKSVQRDTLGYFFFPMYELCGRFGLGTVHYDDLMDVYKTAEREITECMVTGYKNGSFAQLPELSDLYIRMKKSAQAVGSDVMWRYMSGLLSNEELSNSLDVLYGTTTAIDESTLYDNRDVNVIPNFEQGDYAKEIEDAKEQTRQEFNDNITLRDLICRVIGCIGLERCSLVELKSTSALFGVHLKTCRKMYPPATKPSRIMSSPTPTLLSPFVHSVAMDLIQQLIDVFHDIAATGEQGAVLLPTGEEIQEALEGAFPASGEHLTVFCQVGVLISASRAVQYLAICHKLFEALLCRLDRETSVVVPKKKQTVKSALFLQVDDLRGSILKSAKVLYGILDEWKTIVGTRSAELFPMIEQGAYSEVFYTDIFASQDAQVRDRYAHSYSLSFGDMMVTLENILPQVTM